MNAHIATRPPATATVTIFVRNVILGATELSAKRRVQATVTSLTKDAIQALVSARNVMMDTIELTVQRSVRVNAEQMR